MIEVEGVAVYVYPSGTRAVDGVSPASAAASGGHRRPKRVGQVDARPTLQRPLRPAEGRVAIDGTDTATLRVAELAANIGLVFQIRTGRSSRTGSSRGRLRPAQPRGSRRGAGWHRGPRAFAAAGLAGEAAANPYDLGFSR